MVLFFLISFPIYTSFDETATQPLLTREKLNNTLSNVLTECSRVDLITTLADMRILIKRGADINTKEATSGKTCLHYAAEANLISLAKFLIHHHAAVNTTNTLLETALHVAVKFKHKEIVAFLITNGAWLNAQSNGGDTPLHVAAEQGYTDLAQFLIDRRAHVTIKNNNGLTFLQVAQQLGHRDFVTRIYENPIYQERIGTTCSCTIS